MTKKERYEKIIAYFRETQPIAETELDYSDPFQLLVAVILSAQCTDKRVNKITPALFERYPSPAKLAKAEPQEVYPYIQSCSYPNNKAKHLVNMARMLQTDFGGTIPQDLKNLQKLPGVGRKTANVMLSVAFDTPAMAVDTHVFRVAARLGLTTRARTPLDAEQQLTKHIDRALWPVAHHWLILHGRYICLARKPKCDSCAIKNYCKFFSEKDNS